MEKTPVDLISSLGVPVFAMLMMGLFFYKSLWPLIKNQIEQGNIERQKQTERLNTILDRHAEASFQLAERLRQMNESIDGLRRDFNDR